MSAADSAFPVARALHIPAAVLALPGLSLLACAVLAEVLDLHQVKGHVFASDEYLAARCRAKPRTVRETIAELVAAGYLLREVDYSARHKRRLTPAEHWQNLPGVVADSAGNAPEVVAESAGSSGEICRDLWRISPGVVADSANINTSLNTKEKKEGENAADAATPVLLSEKKASGRKQKKAGAQPDEVAALPLPHPGESFAELWATFSTGPKQAGKPLTALDLMLKKLGKYPEAFAIIMLEAAIQGNWSGVENPGTAKAFADWQAQQPPPGLVAAMAAADFRKADLWGKPALRNPSRLFYPEPDEELNHDFIAEQEAKAEAARTARLQRYAQRPASEEPQAPDLPAVAP